MALKWHPLRCEEPDAQANFDEVSEAFEVLANYELRALFDKFGEIALKEGVSDGNGGFLGGNYAYGFNGNEIFESFFGTSNPFASIVEAATTIDVNAPVVVEPESVQTVMPCPRNLRKCLPACSRVRLLVADFRVHHARGRAPGGQQISVSWQSGADI